MWISRDGKVRRTTNPRDVTRDGMIAKEADEVKNPEDNTPRVRRGGKLFLDYALVPWTESCCYH